MIRKCLKKAAALAAALMMALMFIPAGAYAVYAADAGNTVVVGVNADYGISASFSIFSISSSHSSVFIVSTVSFF